MQILLQIYKELDNISFNWDMPLITNQLLYQLSYEGIRINEAFNVKSQINQQLKDMVIKI